MNVCPTCGLPTDAQYVGPPLTAIKFRIFQLISARPGIDADELCSLVYHGEDGGPETGRKTIHVHVCQINRVLASIGARIRIRGNKYHGYRVLRQKGGPA